MVLATAEDLEEDVREERAAPEDSQRQKSTMVITSVYSLLGNLNIKSRFGGIGHGKGGSPTLPLPVLHERPV